MLSRAARRCRRPARLLLEWHEAARQGLEDGVHRLRRIAARALRQAGWSSIWLDVDWQSTLLRAARRDGTRGSPADLMRDAYETGWSPRQLWYEEALHPRDRVDMIIDNSDVERPYVVRAPRPARRVQ